VLKSGTIELPAGSIPSPSGGRSSAVDFTHALLQGNPIAVEAARQAMADREANVTIPKGAPMSDVHDAINKMGGTALRGDPDYVKHDKPEDEASVADKFVASTYDWCRYFKYNAKEEKLITPLLMAYRHAMRQANKFVLDKEFTVLATQLSSSVSPEKLLTRLPLATLPYETTWIEFPLRLKVLTMRAAHGLKGVPDGVAPRMGVLLERVSDTMSTVTMVCEGEEVTPPNLTGYIFSTDEQTLRFNQVFHGLTPLTRLSRRPAEENAGVSGCHERS
jgi:hypothetical protein